MIATIENDTRPCHQCKKEIGAKDNDILFSDPDVDPDVLGLALRFCSMKCTKEYIDLHRERWVAEGKGG